MAFLTFLPVLAFWAFWAFWCGLGVLGVLRPGLPLLWVRVPVLPRDALQSHGACALCVQLCTRRAPALGETRYVAARLLRRFVPMCLARVPLALGGSFSHSLSFGAHSLHARAVCTRIQVCSAFSAFSALSR